MKAAEEYFRNEKLKEARCDIDDAVQKYNDSINPLKLYRFGNIYGGWILLYLTSFLTIIGFVYYYWYIAPNSISNLKEIGIQAIMWGGIGSILKGFWYIRLRIVNKDFQREDSTSFFIAPFIGAVLGALIFMLIYGGLISITQTSNVKNPLVIFFFAGFAGYNWDWAVKLMTNAANTLSNQDGKK